MTKTLLALVSSFGLLSSVAMAADTQSGLDFRKMEARQARDPMLYSYQTGYLQHTSAGRMANAVAAIKAAIPVGTDRAAAEAVLTHAGAHCRADGAAETCRYFDLETPDPDYTDAVNWFVTMRLDNDHVSDLSVDRSWTRG